MIKARFEVERSKLNWETISMLSELPIWDTGCKLDAEKEMVTLVGYFYDVLDLVKKYRTANDINWEYADCVKFTDRFPKPEWFNPISF